MSTPHVQAIQEYTWWSIVGLLRHIEFEINPAPPHPQHYFSIIFTPGVSEESSVNYSIFDTSVYTVYASVLIQA